MNFLKNLIGGQIVKGYSISGEPMTGLGHHKLWKLYKAKKDSTGAEVSVFVIEKKSLKPSSKDQIIKSAKKQVSTLAKIRHPGVLALIQPFTQDEHNISFVTERIEGNLSSIIRSKRFEEMVSSELQLKLTLFPLLQTINFLHEIVKLCHLGLSFQSIYVTADGKWKIGGMNYSQVLTGEEYQPLEGNGDFWDYLHLAPEVVHEKKFNKFSDSYSLGVLFINFMVLLKKTPHNLMQPTESREVYSQNSKSYRDYAQFPAILQSVAPQELIQLLSQLLIDQSTYRLPVSSLESSKWINDPIVLTVKYLQKISNYENKQQVEFLKGLAGVIDKFSGKVLHKRIIPNLTNLLKFNHLVASIVFILIDIMKKNMIAVEDWRKNVWPELKTITQGKQMTAQSLYLLISSMEVMEKFLPEESFMSSIIPLYLKCFDCPPKLKLLALRHVQRLTKKYDYQFTKTKIVPKLVVSMKDEKIQVRKDTLKALYSIINRLDPHTIVNVVLAGLENCRKAGADPFINAITVELYNKITLNMSAEVLANKIMPGLMPYLIDPSIEKEEFGLYKNALLNMMNKIEEQRKKTWSQHNNSGVGSVEKFSEKDFVLEKIETESGSVSNINLSSEVRFEFLNDYKQVGSNSSVGVNAHHKPRSGQNIAVSGTHQSQSSGLSLSFEPVQPVNVGRGQNQAIEITFTDSSFGSEFKSSFETGSYSQKQKVDVNINNKTYPQVKIEPNTKVQNTLQLDINSLVQSNTTSNYGIGYSNNNNHTLPKKTKVAQYSPTQLEFAAFNQFQTHAQSKEIPFSPSTSPQTQLNKPQIKGPQEVTGKKLVGPGQGGLKKPTKHNEFSLPSTNNQTPGYVPLSFDSGFTTQPVNKPAASTFDASSFFNIGSSSTKTIVQSPPQGFGLQNKSDDPFAEVQSHYGVNNMASFSFNQPVSSGLSLNLNPSTSQSQSKDPFDDLL